MAIRTISNAGGNWSATTAWVEGIVPTSADEIRATGTSGNLTLNVDGYCRSIDLTNYVGTFTHGVYNLKIGDSITPTSFIALKWAGTYVFTGNVNSNIVFVSTAPGNHTLDYGGKTLASASFSTCTSEYTFINNNVTLINQIQLSSGTVHFGALTYSCSALNCVNNVARTIDFGTSTIITGTTYGATFSNTNFTILPNSGTLSCIGGSLSCPDGTNFNGMSLKITGGSGSFSLSNTCTFRNLIFSTTGSSNFTIGAGKILTLTDNFWCYPKSGTITFSGGSIFKATGTVKMYSAIISTTVFGGGATWKAYHNCIVPAWSVVTNHGGFLCIDPEKGSDANFIGYGWWKIDYTNSSGTLPDQDEVGIGSVSGATCKIMGMVDEYDWLSHSGTLYFYGKVGTFQNETITFTNGGSISVTADMLNAAWLTYPTAIKHSIYDSIHYCKAPEPTNTGQNAAWTSTILRGGATGPAVTPTSSTNTSPITVTKALHGFVTGDVIYFVSHTGNTAANGVWSVTKVSDNIFSLDSSVGNGVGGATGQIYPMTSKAVVLTTPVTTMISDCNSNWTPGLNVTAANTQASYYKLGVMSIMITTNASCGANQIIAKAALPASLDLSSKKQVSFWFRCYSNIIANTLYLKLYSDTACTIEVDSFPIPASFNPNVWLPLTINKGSAISSTVQGVALYTTATQPSKTFFIDNILACKDASLPDSITLTSLISKNIANQHIDDLFVGIQSINGKVIMLDSIIESTPLGGRGYYGVTESVPLFKRETQNCYNSVVQPGSVTRGGSATVKFYILGGFDKSNNVQNGITILDGVCGANTFFQCNMMNYIDMNAFHFVRYGYGVQYCTMLGVMSNIIATNCGYGLSYPNGQSLWTVTNFRASGCGSALYAYSGSTCLFTFIVAYSCTGYGLYFFAQGSATDVTVCNSGGIYTSNYANYMARIKANYNTTGFYLNSGTYKLIIDDILECNSNTIGLSVGSTIVAINKIWSLDNNNYGIQTASAAHSLLVKEIVHMNNNNCGISFGGFNHKILKITEANANSIPIQIIGQENYIYNATVTNSIGTYPVTFNTGKNYFINCSFPTLPVALYNQSAGNFTYIHFHNFNRVIDDHRIYSDGGTIFTDAIERHSLSGISWKFSVLHAGRDVNYPLVLQVAKILCTAGVLKTIGIWVKKSHATDIGARIVINGNKFEGVGSSTADVFTEAVNATGWQQISMSFTPTKTEVIEVEFWAYWQANAATQSIWVDDISII